MNPPPPKTLGRYQVIEEIGKGAMGVVYLAKDPAIGRLVALKTFRLGEVSDEERVQYRARFMREAQSAGILSHPNIVTIHDFVEDAGEGMTFIAMEFIRGTNLKELLRREDPFDLTFIADVIWQVAEALEYAHSKGVVHRDIKPANILITADDRMKLTDFGIARLNDPSLSELTHAGQLLGTPNYMSPEQLLAKEVNHQTDVFSLGVVLYEMLTRHKPFQGDNLTVVTQRILHDAFTPPEQYVGELPTGLGEVLSRALAKKQEDRYQRVGELARDLKAVVEQVRAQGTAVGMLPVVPRPPASPPPPAPPPTPAAPPASPLAGLQSSLRRFATRVRAWRPRLPAWVSAEASGPLPSWRYALAAVIGILLGLGIGYGALAWIGPEDTAAEESAMDLEIAHRFHYLPWVWMGRSLSERGEASAAAAAFSEAERRAPDEAWLRDLRQQAEQAASLEVNRLRKAEEIGVLLDAGEDAFSSRRYAEAEEIALQVLELVPADPRAAQLLALARDAQQRQAGRTAARRSEPSISPPRREASPVKPPPPAQARPANPESRPVPQVAELRVVFRSEISEGVLTLYADEDQMLREEFRFIRKKGLFRSEAVPGGFERRLELNPGQQSLRVYVALERTLVETVEGNFPAGSSRTLVIGVAASGRLTVALR